MTTSPGIVERLVTLPDRRVLRVEEAGDPQGRPVLTHHGMPGAGHLYGAHAEDARSRGIRLIAYDRPGYGGSTALSGRSIGDCAADVRAIADALRIERLAVWGHSGGGPHALACAALLPDLVVGVASLASGAPYGSPDLDYFAGMGQENVDSIKQALEDEPAARAKLESERQAILAMTADDMAKAFPTLLSPVDAAAQTPELTEFIVGCMHDGLASNGEGWWDDGMASLHPWGFSVESIEVPVQLWHGRQDWFVPFQHGEWLASRIPGVDAHLTSDDGHLTLLQQRVGEVHAWLLERF